MRAGLLAAVESIRETVMAHADEAETRGTSPTPGNSPVPASSHRPPVQVGAQHLMVSTIAYENHGQFALGIPGAGPLR